jgi:hypothetical protein
VRPSDECYDRVHMTPLFIGILLGVAQAATPPATGPSRPFEITDNSFLVEEAFNQEPKIFQNIFNWSRTNQLWQMTFTQEWPVPGERHQLSYTLVLTGIDGVDRFGDALVNYRLQVLDEGPGRPAFAPRVTAILPTGSRAIGAHQGGVQVNLPFSKQDEDFYFHWNAGATYLPRKDRADLWSPQLAGSAIYRVADMVNAMLETVLTYAATDQPDGRTIHLRALTLSPGIRGGWNLKGEKQIVIGAAVPITWTTGTVLSGVFAYFSYELPFTK